MSSNTTKKIVGIGASAGGLTALEHFFKNTPYNSGLSYIVVQHLEPNKKGLLPELLQRFTDMPVLQARQSLVIKPNHVYVIPPNSDLRVKKGSLELAPSSKTDGLRLPVDILFNSLAKEFGENAIGVILSGMGSDGTLGLQEIKKQGGLTLVQTPNTAQYDSMPKSAIEAGCVDIVAPTEELPQRIFTSLRVLPQSNHAALTGNKTNKGFIKSILDLLRDHTRHDFSLYKPSTLQRRIDRRVAVHGLLDYKAYLEFLEKNPTELDLLFKELLIGVTSFFRDPLVWRYLEVKALPALLNGLPRPYRLRVWCAGCSTGEEAYSVAMVLSDVIESLPDGKGVEFQIFASDLSADAISIARRGEYPLSIAKQISPSRLAKYFKLTHRHYVINGNLRDKVLFAQHNLVLDPPFTKLDMLLCRNLLIYFDATLQHRILPLFHYSLRPGGLLLLGGSETVGEAANLFKTEESKLRLFKRLENPPNHVVRGIGYTLPIINPTTIHEHHVSKSSTTNNPFSQNLQDAADHLLLQVYAPAAVVLNAASDIVYISGRTGKYLEPAAGKANWNFHAMVRDGLRAPLFNALNRAAIEDRAVELHGLQTEIDNPGSLIVDVTIQKLSEPPALKDMFMVVFRDAGSLSDRHALLNVQGNDAHKGILRELKRQQEENQRLREENRAAQEELQSSNEELQSTNEELQSTNEELQSTNEELTSSKEETQSMIEELQKINFELQTKLDDLTLAQSDLQNLLNSTEIAILFLDRQLNVRRFTEQAAKIISLRESDVGRPLSDLSNVMNYPELCEDAAETLRTLAFSQKEVSSNDGRRFVVCLRPYKRLDNVIDGVVITLLLKQE